MIYRLLYYLLRFGPSLFFIITRISFYSKSKGVIWIDILISIVLGIIGNLLSKLFINWINKGDGG